MTLLCSSSRLRCLVQLVVEVAGEVMLGLIELFGRPPTQPKTTAPGGLHAEYR
jgi:hypothetical protein